jgi:predicted nucleotidyltransferase
VKGVVVDLLFAASGIEDVLVAQADTIQVLPGLQLPVARVGHLLATKVLARDDKRRPQDAADLRALLAEAEQHDLALAETALALITQRGFARGRDLKAAWRALLDEQSGE